MNINYILTKEHIKINGQKVSVGNTFNDINSKSALFISQKNNDILIASEQDFQLHFKEHVLYMWSLSPESSFFKYDSKKYKLNTLKFNDFLKILFRQKISWEFNKELTISDQICIQLENNVSFIFRFNKDHKKGVLKKVVAM